MTENVDLSKTVEISAEEETKLAAFLNKINQNIKDDAELEGLLGGAITQWKSELEQKTQKGKGENEGILKDA